VTEAVPEAVLPWLSAAAAAVGLVEPIGRAFSVRAARKLLERFNDLQRTAEALRTLGPNHGPSASPSARIEHRRLVAAVDDEARLVLADYARRTRRRPGSMAFAVVAWLYGSGLSYLGYLLLIAPSTADRTDGVLIAATILWAGAFFCLIYGLLTARRRLLTRDLRIKSGIRDQYTGPGMHYSWRRLKRIRQRSKATKRAKRIAHSPHLAEQVHDVMATPDSHRSSTSTATTEQQRAAQQTTDAS